MIDETAEKRIQELEKTMRFQQEELQRLKEVKLPQEAVNLEESPVVKKGYQSNWPFFMTRFIWRWEAKKLKQISHKNSKLLIFGLLVLVAPFKLVGLVVAAPLKLFEVIVIRAVLGALFFIHGFFSGISRIIFKIISYILGLWAFAYTVLLLLFFWTNVISPLTLYFFEKNMNTHTIQKYFKFETRSTGYFPRPWDMFTNSSWKAWIKHKRKTDPDFRKQDDKEIENYNKYMNNLYKRR